MNNCYECKFRQNIPGNSHIQCIIGSSLFIYIVNTTNISFNKYHLIYKVITDNYNIKLIQHGVENNWCTWPFNFDPI